MPPPVQLHVVIVGAGIAGLCTAIALAQQGHRITSLESSAELSPVGAGIHLPPNATLLLKRWGVLELLADKAVVPKGFNFRRYADGRVLARVGGGKVSNEGGLGTPYWSVKRSDYQRALHQAAMAAGCELRLGSRVQSVDENGPTVTLTSGEVIHGDLIVAADGMKSRLRQLIIPETDASPVPYPMATYRAWAPTDELKANPDIAALLEQPASNVWLGPGRHVIFYPAEGGKILAINGTYPSRHDEVGAWNKPASVEEVQSQFHDFNSVVKSVLAEARDCKSWALAEVPKLERWTSKSGKVVIIGDAAHGMLQFLAQGAAMATEDAGALAECIRTLKSKDEIPAAMHLYERSRKARGEEVQAQARRNGDCIHMLDGEVQRRRDRKMAGEALPDDEDVDCGPLLDDKFTAWLYGHDVVEHTKQVLSDAKS